MESRRRSKAQIPEAEIELPPMIGDAMRKAPELKNRHLRTSTPEKTGTERFGFRGRPSGDRELGA